MTKQQNEWPEGRTVTMKIHFSQELLQQMAYLKKKMRFDETGRKQHAKPSDITAEQLKTEIADLVSTLGWHEYGVNLGCDVETVTNDPNVSVEVQIEREGDCKVDGVRLEADYTGFVMRY